MKLFSVLEPAASIIRKLGGEANVSKITGTRIVAPYRWQYPRERGGTGGLIPQRHHPAILAYARANCVAVQADDFLPINVPSSPSCVDGPTYAARASTDPIPEISRSPAAVRPVSVAPASEGVA